MNVANCRRLVSLLMYCCVAVLVIVNGQSTTDDDIDKDESSRMVDIVEVLRAEFRAELAKSTEAINSLKSQLAVSQDEIEKLKHKGKDKKPE